MIFVLYFLMWLIKSIIYIFYSDDKSESHLNNNNVKCVEYDTSTQDLHSISPTHVAECSQNESGPDTCEDE